MKKCVDYSRKWLSWQQVLSHKYQYQYQYQRSKYQYKYQYLACKYKYKYQYPKIVLKYRSSTSTSTQYNKTGMATMEDKCYAFLPQFPSELCLVKWPLPLTQWPKTVSLSMHDTGNISTESEFPKLSPWVTIPSGTDRKTTGSEMTKNWCNS